MTQEEKELLLKDLYARLPYNVMVRVEVNDVFIKPTDEVATTCTINMFEYPQKFRITPYLRPMSSLSKAERAQLEFAQELDMRDATEISISHTLEFFLEHYLDFHGLIPMGLALEAPEDMYKN